MNDIMKDWITEFLNNSDTLMYKNHCVKFLDYLVSVNKTNRPNDIDKDDIRASIKKYNVLGKINTYSTMTNHLEAIKAFYDYAQKNGKTDNIFNTIADYSSYKQKIADEFELTDTSEREFLPDEIIIKLLEYFDANKNDQDSDFQLIKVFTKITLIAPAKRKIIAEIKFSDFKNEYREVVINEVLIKIPNSLRNDIISAVNSNNDNSKDAARLFEHICSRAYSHNVFNKPLYDVLEKIDYDLPKKKNTFSVEAIMNSSIMHMIKNNTNPYLIAKINGVSLSTIEKKIKKYGIEIDDYSSLINKSIMNTVYYHYI